MSEAFGWLYIFLETTHKILQASHRSRTWHNGQTGGLSPQCIHSILKPIVELAFHPQNSLFCAAYLTFKSSIACNYASTLVSLLLTHPQYNKTKEERGIRGGHSQREGEKNAVDST